MSTGHIRVAVVGNVDSGKSTLIGTIKSSILDDGRGLSRSTITKHKHELVSGRTSTISQHMIGFDENGQVLRSSSSKNKKSCLSLSEIAQRSARVVTMMDLAGHEKYLRTTVAGLSMGMIDYALVLVNASQHNSNHMTMHHLKVCNACAIPVVIVLTKVGLVITTLCLSDGYIKSSFHALFLHGHSSIYSFIFRRIHVQVMYINILRK